MHEDLVRELFLQAETNPTVSVFDLFIFSNFFKCLNNAINCFILSRKSTHPPSSDLIFSVV